MTMKRFTKSTTLLLELVAAIALFAVAAGICARVLTAAQALSAQAEELSLGVEAVTAAAELLRASDDEAAALKALEENAALSIQRQEAEGLVHYDIMYISGGETLYSLELVKGQEVVP